MIFTILFLITLPKQIFCINLQCPFGSYNSNDNSQLISCQSCDSSCQSCVGATNTSCILCYEIQEARNNACPSCATGSYENLAGECVTYDTIQGEYQNFLPFSGETTTVIEFGQAAFLAIQLQNEEYLQDIILELLSTQNGKSASIFYILSRVTQSDSIALTKSSRDALFDLYQKISIKYLENFDYYSIKYLINSISNTIVQYKQLKNEEQESIKLTDLETMETLFITKFSEIQGSGFNANGLLEFAVQIIEPVNSTDFVQFTFFNWIENNEYIITNEFYDDFSQNYSCSSFNNSNYNLTVEIDKNASTLTLQIQLSAFLSCGWYKYINQKKIQGIIFLRNSETQEQYYTKLSIHYEIDDDTTELKIPDKTRINSIIQLNSKNIEEEHVISTKYFAVPYYIDSDGNYLSIIKSQNFIIGFYLPVIKQSYEYEITLTAIQNDTYYANLTSLQDNFKITLTEIQRSSLSANNEFFYQATIESSLIRDGIYNFTTYAQAKLTLQRRNLENYQKLELAVTKNIDVEIFGTFNLTGFANVKVEESSNIVVIIIIVISIFVLIIIVFGIIKYYNILKQRRHQARQNNYIVSFTNQLIQNTSDTLIQNKPKVNTINKSNEDLQQKTQDDQDQSQALNNETTPVILVVNSSESGNQENEESSNQLNKIEQEESNDRFNITESIMIEVPQEKEKQNLTEKLNEQKKKLQEQIKQRRQIAKSKLTADSQNNLIDESKNNFEKKTQNKKISEQEIKRKLELLKKKKSKLRGQQEEN